jgi:hypothetical protein
MWWEISFFIVKFRGEFWNLNKRRIRAFSTAPNGHSVVGRVSARARTLAGVHGTARKQSCTAPLLRLTAPGRPVWNLRPGSAAANVEKATPESKAGRPEALNSVLVETDDERGTCQGGAMLSCPPAADWLTDWRPDGRMAGFEAETLDHCSGQQACMPASAGVGLSSGQWWEWLLGPV